MLSPGCGVYGVYGVVAPSVEVAAAALRLLYELFLLVVPSDTSCNRELSAAGWKACIPVIACKFSAEPALDYA